MYRETSSLGKIWKTTSLILHHSDSWTLDIFPVLQDLVCQSARKIDVCQAGWNSMGMLLALTNVAFSETTHTRLLWSLLYPRSPYGTLFPWDREWSLERGLEAKQLMKSIRGAPSAVTHFLWTSCLWHDRFVTHTSSLLNWGSLIPQTAQIRQNLLMWVVIYVRS